MSEYAVQFILLLSLCAATVFAGWHTSQTRYFTLLRSGSDCSAYKIDGPCCITYKNWISDEVAIKPLPADGVCLDFKPLEGK